MTQATEVKELIVKCGNDNSSKDYLARCTVKFKIKVCKIRK